MFSRPFKIFRDLCGKKCLKDIVLVTNTWGVASFEAGEAREKELSAEFFKPALGKGAQMARHHNTEQSAHGIIRRVINNHPVVFQIQHDLVDERKDVANSAAGCRTRGSKKWHDAEVKKAEMG